MCIVMFYSVKVYYNFFSHFIRGYSIDTLLKKHKFFVEQIDFESLVFNLFISDKYLFCIKIYKNKINVL